VAVALHTIATIFGVAVLINAALLNPLRGLPRMSGGRLLLWREKRRARL
jgi:hypothetical protein